jgi:phage terminase Nu1 subunit (DNA packaging protein)
MECADVRVTAKQLADWYGVEPRTVVNWVNSDPPCPSTKEGRLRYFDSAAVAKWREERAEDAALARLPGSNAWELARARTRKTLADAQLAEIELERERGETIAVATVRATWAKIAAGMRAQLLSIPGRFAARTVGLNSLPESQRMWDAAIRDVLGELRDGGTHGANLTSV